jgi:hypothetical protein
MFIEEALGQMFGNFHWPQTNFPDLKYYEDALVSAGVVSLFLRRKTICEKLFDQMRDETSHTLLSLVPPRHKTGYSLRNNNCLSLPKHRTSRFANSFFLAGSKSYKSSFK